MARGSNGARRVHLTNAQRHAIIEEFKRQNSDGENASFQGLAEWPRRDKTYDYAKPLHFV